MPKINRTRSLRVAELSMSVRASVQLAISDREKEFGAASAAISPLDPPLDGMFPVYPDDTFGPIVY